MLSILLFMNKYYECIKIYKIYIWVFIIYFKIRYIYPVNKKLKGHNDKNHITETKKT